MIDPDQQWRDSLKVGDEVAVKEDGRYSIHKIESVTDTRIFTKYHKVRRRNGYGFDSQGKAAEIVPVTPEMKQTIEDAFERKRLRAVISLALPTASADTLRAMIKALECVPEEVHDEPISAPENGRRWRPGR